MKKALFNLAEALTVGTALVIIMVHFGLFPAQKRPIIRMPVFDPFDTAVFIQVTAPKGFELSWISPIDTFVHFPVPFYDSLQDISGSKGWQTATPIQFQLWVRKKK